MYWNVYSTNSCLAIDSVNNSQVGLDTYKSEKKDSYRVSISETKILT